jgi:ubiquinone biosynthesis protein
MGRMPEAVPTPPPPPDSGGGGVSRLDPGSGESGFELFVEGKPPTILRRLFTTHRHFVGLAFGGLGAWIRGLPRTRRNGFKFRLAQVAWWLTRPFVDSRLAALPFPAQLRRRLETLGPTYIKLGQILSLREDVLPSAVTDELKNLLDRLPAVPHARFCELVERSLERPVDEVFARIDEQPLGSASIGQVHKATLASGEEVILKVVKPGIRETVRRDVVLLKLLGRMLQVPLSRIQPQRVIDEFCYYTLREVDLRIEADNAETFAANFKDEPDIVFPEIYRKYSTQDVLCMEFLDGMKPNSQGVRDMPEEDRDRIIDLGASAIIRMLYRDGFFHADLHPGNLVILPGPRAGFIDLGMVGRFDEELKRTLLYYYYCLVTGDAENAARYLASLADLGPKSDVKGFMRKVEETCRRWHRASSFEEFSLGQLIMESVAEGAVFRVYFPVEMVLMVKAIVTFEGVGHVLKPGFDVAEVSQRHINRIFLHQFSPLRIAREGLRGAPELVDALVKTPMLITQSLRALDRATRTDPENPFAGLRGTLLGGFCLVSGAILAAFNFQTLWPLSVGLFLLGLILAMRRA